MSSNITPSPQHMQRFSCLTCRQRKVKCDRRSPCANCTRADKQCSFVAPVRGKRKRLKPPKEGLHAKLKRYERLLKSYGVTDLSTPSPASDIDLDSDGSDQREQSDTDHARRDMEGSANLRASQKTEAKLVVDRGNSRYYDSPLWSNLGDALHHPESSGSVEQTNNDLDIEESQLFFGPETNSVPKRPACSHPPHHVLSKLRDVYIERVDTLVKILHIPSFWELLLDGHAHPDSTTASQSALVYAFYLSTINTMDDEECRNTFQLQQTAAFAQYKSAARQTLVKAGFPATSSPMTLQAYALYTICVRNCYPCDTLYIMSGIAIRLARKMGLHRDGATLGLSPFETEMRRRLWWHLVHVDSRITDVLGTRPSLDLSCGDAKTPLNINDGDLYPGMAQLPEARKDITPITLCVIRCEITDSLKSISPSPSASMRWEGLIRDPDIASSKKHRIIDAIEDRLEGRYMRYCDPSNTFHTYVSIIIRSAICKMRLFAHKPPSLVNKRDPASNLERDSVFSHARKLLGYATLLKGGMPGLEKYMWHIGTSYLWNVMLYVLIEVRRRKTGPEVDKCWDLLGTVFTKYPQVREKQAGAVYALGKWTLKVWDEYVAATKEQGPEAPLVPEYISRLQSDHARDSTPSADIVGDRTHSSGGQRGLRWPGSEHDTQMDSLPAYDFSNPFMFESDPNDWTRWDQLLAEQVGFT